MEFGRKRFFIRRELLGVLVNDDFGLVEPDTFFALFPCEKLPKSTQNYLNDCGSDSSSVFSHTIFSKSSTIFPSSLLSLVTPSDSG